MKQDLNEIKVYKDECHNLWRVEIVSFEHGENFIDLGHGRNQKSAIHFAKIRIKSLLKAIESIERA